MSILILAINVNQNLPRAIYNIESWELIDHTKIMNQVVYLYNNSKHLVYFSCLAHICFAWTPKLSFLIKLSAWKKCTVLASNILQHQF
jgi:hypothetical protein